MALDGWQKQISDYLPDGVRGLKSLGLHCQLKKVQQVLNK